MTIIHKDITEVNDHPNILNTVEPVLNMLKDHPIGHDKMASQNRRSGNDRFICTKMWDLLAAICGSLRQVVSQNRFHCIIMLLRVGTDRLYWHSQSYNFIGIDIIYALCNAIIYPCIAYTPIINQ